MLNMCFFLFSQHDVSFVGFQSRANFERVKETKRKRDKETKRQKKEDTKRKTDKEQKLK